jgi:hypothetical protein
MTIELYMDADPPYMIAPVGNIGAIDAAEAALPRGFCVGEGWTCGVRQPDGHWLLYVRPLTAAEMPFDRRVR